MLRSLIVVLLSVTASIALSAEVRIGDRVTLKSAESLGILVHREARPSVASRADDGSTGTVRALDQGGAWARVELDNGTSGWVVSRQLEAGAPSAVVAPTVPPVAAGIPSDDDVWSSPSECRRRVVAGERLAKSASSVRFITWNIRWFPYGSPDEPGQETDLDWLACVIAWMQPDVMAVQEILSTREADVAWAAVFDGVEAFVGGDWRLDLQECGGERNQHVGFVWNQDRVALSDGRDVWQLNGAATGAGGECANNLRPGRAAYAATPGGLDIHVVVVHLDSGVKSRDFDNRQAAIARLDGAYADLRSQIEDADVIVLGDFNTMGANGRLTGPEEIRTMRARAGNEAPAGTLAPRFPRGKRGARVPAGRRRPSLLGVL